MAEKVGKGLGKCPLLQRTLPAREERIHMTTVVWFKRDLRTRDHAPLVAAASQGEPVIPLYVIEDASHADGNRQLPAVAALA